MMSKGNGWFKDRLADRGSIDQWGFIFFAVAGFVGILSAKWLKADTTWVAVGAVVAMMVYAVVIARRGNGRLQADQAGDNCYYLGLIYTLASLSYAIATFDPINPATTIVQGFGVALATTIFGLILRVFFSQGRPDLENAEEQTRLELSDAVSKLKGELSVVVRELSELSRQVQQSMGEVQSSVKKTIEEFTKVSVEGLQGVVEAASGTIRDEANDFATRSKKYSTSFDKLISKLESHGDVVGRAVSVQELLLESSTSARLTAEHAKDSVEALLKSSDSTRLAAESAQSAISSLESLVGGLAVTTEGLSSTVNRMKEETDRRIGELSTGPAESLAAAMDTLARFGAAIEKQVSELQQIHNDARSHMASQSESAIEMSRRHNDGLEKELERSRQLVTHVHKSLADMTGNLADRVEGSA